MMDYQTIVDEVKNILVKCNNEINQVDKERNEYIEKSMTEEQWKKYVLQIMSYDFLRIKSASAIKNINIYHYMITHLERIHIDCKKFYDDLIAIGPHSLQVVTKQDIENIFAKDNKKNSMVYETFFNGKPVDFFGIKNSFDLLQDKHGTYYAYMPDISNLINMNTVESAKEIYAYTFSYMYLPENNRMYKWYKLSTEGLMEKKHSEEYYDEKISDIKEKYNCIINEYIEKIVHVSNNVRMSFPYLQDYKPGMENDKYEFPERFTFGEYKITVNNKNVNIPNFVLFPFTSSLIFKEEDLYLIHQLYLKLLYALPIGKLEFTVFDPNGLGENIEIFNSLIKCKEIFTAQKVLKDKKELKDELLLAMDYIRNIRQEIFGDDCTDWVTYNKKMLKDNPLKVLPYKVYTFFDIPNQMDEENISMISKLIRHGMDCGILVLFSYKEISEKNIDGKWNVLKECINTSKTINDVFRIINKDTMDIINDLNGKIEFKQEEMPLLSDVKLLLEDYINKLNSSSKVEFDFNKLIDIEHLFNKTSENGLEFILGYNDESGELIKLYVDDANTHYLIGGTTGSGKSNLLHNIILSACSRYSPKELQLYMLDFKEGVEFSIYTQPTLPHARLVATEADTEYGVKVLAHLIKEKEKRYKLFKKCGCKDILSYRQSNPLEIMPRILVVIDEFQVLFGNSDRSSTIENLEMLAKQGRACGIHLIMATQTLSGLEFGTLESQFSGRIALKCSAEDSKRLLGGISSNNEAASTIERPYAIVNTSQGSVSGNIKINVPKADMSIIKNTINVMRNNLKADEIVDTVIFEGQTLPEHPIREAFTDNKTRVMLGINMDFTAEPFTVRLMNKECNNIMCCGSDERIKKGLIKSIMYSALFSSEIDEFVYVGEDESILEWEDEEDIICFDGIRGFLEYLGEDMFSRKRLVVLDNCDLVKEVNYPTGYGQTPSGDAKKILDYINEGCRYGCFVIVFYNRIRNMKNSKMPLDKFDYRIGYGLNDDDTRALVDNMSLGKVGRITERCFFAKNGEIENWFQPYVMEIEDDE